MYFFSFEFRVSEVKLNHQQKWSEEMFEHLGGEARKSLVGESTLKLSSDKWDPCH